MTTWKWVGRGLVVAALGWFGWTEYTHRLRTEAAWLYLVQELAKTADGRPVRLGDVVADLVNTRVQELKADAAKADAEKAGK